MKKSPFPLIVGPLILMSLAACGSHMASRDALDRIGEVRTAADKAFFDDCRVKTKVVTQKRDVEVLAPCGLVKALGAPVLAANLIALFESRVESNRTARSGPMAGNVQAIIYFGGDLLYESEAKEAIPVLSSLLSDPDPKNSSAVAMILFAMGQKSAALRSEVQKLSFPYKTIADLHVPAWAKVVR